MSDLDHLSPKAEWRQWARRLHRSGLADPAGPGILSHAARYLEGVAPTTVVLFAHLPGEVSVDGLADTERHDFALTRTPPTGWLTIHPWTAPRETHPFGFSQPVGQAPEVPFDQIGVVVVPALAFDRSGVRLGRGAGYYDELFSRLPPSVLRVGVTPAALVVERLPRAPHDAVMDLLITEDGLIDTSRCAPSDDGLNRNRDGSAEPD